jgi:hypothetical protein
MVTVDEYARIRRAHYVEGLSIKALARRFHHLRRKIREILIYRCSEGRPAALHLLCFITFSACFQTVSVPDSVPWVSGG